MSALPIHLGGAALRSGSVIHIEDRSIMTLLRRIHGKSLGRMKFGWLALAVPLIASVLLLTLGVVVLTRPKRTVAYRLNMLCDLVPNRQRLAERIAVEAKKQGLEVRLSEKAYGTLDQLALVNAPNEIDVTLVPGGVGKNQFPDIRQITAMGVEPLHLLVKSELYEEATRHGLRALEGKRINIGLPTMGTYVLSSEVLRFAGLTPTAESSSAAPKPRTASLHPYQVENLTPQQLLERANQVRDSVPADRARLLAEMPDAALILAPMPSQVVRSLVNGAGFRLVGIPFTEAFTLDRFDAEGSEGEDRSGTGIPPLELDRSSISTVEIPPYTYGIDPPVPDSPCRTIGTQLLLVGYSRSNREAVAKLVETVFESPVSSLARPPRLENQVPQFEFHEGTSLYLRSKRPFFTPELVSQLSKLLGGTGALASGLVAFYGFLKLRQLRRFEAYYKEIRHIELIARGLEDEPLAPPATRPAERLAFLEQRLNDLKCEALKDFADGGMKGEGLMSGITALVNDTRDSLARIASGPDRSDRP